VILSFYGVSEIAKFTTKMLSVTARVDMYLSLRLSHSQVSLHFCNQKAPIKGIVKGLGVLVSPICEKKSALR
jgi:hypothetical protein